MQINIYQETELPNQTLKESGQFIVLSVDLGNPSTAKLLPRKLLIE